MSATTDEHIAAYRKRLSELRADPPFAGPLRPRAARDILGENADYDALLSLMVLGAGPAVDDEPAIDDGEQPEE